MAKKLFTASVEIGMLVYAEDEKEAQRIAGQHMRDELMNVFHDDIYVTKTGMVEGKPLLPDGWDMETGVYGTDYKTVKEVVDEIAAANREGESSGA